MTRLVALVLLGGAAVAAFFWHGAFALTQEEIESQITNRNQKIEGIEKEIAQYQKELTDTAKEKQTLQSAVATLDLSLKKLTANIRLTEAKIANTNARIRELGGNISDKEESIRKSRSGIRAAFRSINEGENVPLIEQVLSGERLTEALDALATARQFQATLQEKIEELRSLKRDLENQKTDTEKFRRELQGLRAKLADEKRGLDIAKGEKQKLLSATKNKEANYQKILTDKIAAKAAFERELDDFESQLRLLIDPGSIPPARKGVLSWPLDDIYITQYFGNTAFASANPSVYNGKGHNGVDLRASVGTRAKAARAGIVKGTGDTDLTCPNASYGKWVLLEHDNGLSTLYAHLSYIQVQTGQQVGLGQIVGYSGTTGYSTGPHLHFTTYATQGVKITQFPSKSIYCKGKVYTMPVADQRAYLNPLSYF